MPTIKWKNKVIKYLAKELQLWPSPDSPISSHRKVKGILIGTKLHKRLNKHK